jgi:urea carboxylase-associated protein 2
LLTRGQTLRIVNDGATAGVSALFWNQDDTSERYNAGDTVKVQWSAAIGKGRVLLSDMGRVLMSVTEDSSGAHDALLGGSTAATNLSKYGNEATRNSRDNFILVIGKHGLGRRDVPPCITFFAPVRTDAAGRFTWQVGAVKPGDFVDLRAEMNVLVALSTCPHPLDPDPLWAPKPIRAIVWRSGESARDDYASAGLRLRRSFGHSRDGDSSASPSDALGPEAFEGTLRLVDGVEGIFTKCCWSQIWRPALSSFLRVRSQNSQLCRARTLFRPSRRGEQFCV